MTSARTGGPPRPAARSTSRSTAGSGRRPAARPARPRRRRKPSRLRRAIGLWPVIFVLVGVVVAVSWETESQGVPPIATGCTITDAGLTLTTEQAANAATIAAVARARGLPQRATVIALATAQQESRLRNLDYGDRDSLGLFQQRPSQGWGTPEQVQDPVYSAGIFLDRLVDVPGWESGTLTEISQSVQRSGFPDAYAQWEGMAQQISNALLSDAPGRLSCSFSPPDATGPLADRTAAVATVAGRELGLAATADVAGVVQIDPAGGWPAAKWAVAHAERLQLARVALAGWQWTPESGWQESAPSPQLTVTLTS